MLECIVVCVNYADYLSETLPYLKKVADHVLVITDCEDAETVTVAKEYEASVLRTNAFYRDGAPFNKGAAINEGLKQLEGSGWVLHVDADIVLPSPLPLNSLDPNTLYTVLRKSVFPEAWDRVRNGKPGKLPMLPIRYFGGHVMPIGYFQLWHHGKVKQFYPECFTDASDSDSCFSLKWPGPNRALLPGLNAGDEYVAYHLETRDQEKGGNWKIRTSQRVQESRRQIPFSICLIPNLWGNFRHHVQSKTIENWKLQNPRSILLFGNDHEEKAREDKQDIIIKHFDLLATACSAPSQAVRLILENTIPGEIIVFTHPTACFCGAVDLNEAFSTCSGTYYNYIGTSLSDNSDTLNNTGFIAVNRALLKVFAENSANTNQTFNEWLSFCSTYNIPVIDLSTTASITKQLADDGINPHPINRQLRSWQTASDAATTEACLYKDNREISSIADIQARLLSRTTHILRSGVTGTELSPYYSLQGLNCLGLIPGADVIVMRSAPAWRMKPVLLALRDMGCITHLIVQRDVAAEYDGLCNHSYVIAPGPFDTDSISPERARSLQSLQPACALVVYLLPSAKYWNIHAVLRSLKLNCFQGGIKQEGDLTVIEPDIEPAWLSMLRFVPFDQLAVVANANPDRVLDVVKQLRYRSINVRLIVHKSDVDLYKGAQQNIDFVVADPEAQNNQAINHSSSDLVLVVSEKPGNDHHTHIEHELAFLRLDCPWVRFRPGQTLAPIKKHWDGPWFDTLRLTRGDHVVVAPSAAPWQVRPYIFRLIDAGVHVHLVIFDRDKDAYSTFHKTLDVIHRADWNESYFRKQPTSHAPNQMPRYVLIIYNSEDRNSYADSVSNVTACGFTAPLIGIGEYGQLRPIKN